MTNGSPITTDVSTRTLVESLVRQDATIDAAELYEVANALGMTDQQVRLCIRRLVADDQLTQHGRGRKALLRASGAIKSSIEPNAEFVRFMFAQDRGESRWDGLWHLVAFAIPESNRHARDAMRDRVIHLGGAPIQGGLYVSPNPWEAHIQKLTSELGVHQNVTSFTTTDLKIANMDDPREIANHLWPLDHIADGHKKLTIVAKQHLKRLGKKAEISSTDATVAAIELATEFTLAMEPDPLLPLELLPRPWPGTHARTLVAEAWSVLLDSRRTSNSPRLFRAYEDIVKYIVE